MAQALLDEIADRIRTAGPLPFDAYMRLALYDPERGYYATRVPGEGGHYGTSPSVSPWFGRLVVRELEAMWRALGQPATFTVIEVGAGRADLAASALAGAEEPFSASLHWRIVEQFEAVATLQARRLGAAAGRVAWSSRLGDPPAAGGCVLAHEVLDNFPVHLLEQPPPPEVPREIYVALEGARLVEQPGPPSDRRLIGGQAAGRRRFEVCTEIEPWLAEASKAIERGYLLLIDYGDLEDDLWAKNPEGTIVTYGADGFGHDPLADPGERDITADVNFSAVERAAARCGFARQLFATQRDWLAGLGLPEVAARLEAAADDAWRQGRSGEAMAAEEELALLRTLSARMGLGDIMVFRAAKDAPLPGPAPTPAPAAASGHPGDPGDPGHPAPRVPPPPATAR